MQYPHAQKSRLERQFTATAYIIKRGKVLLVQHPKLHKWLPPGGHLEENETPPECAKREVFEETGLHVELIKQENVWVNCWNAASFERPYLCLLENIPPHGDHPAHQHIDLIYLASPVGGQELAELVEQGKLRWFSGEQVAALRTDEEIFGETQQTIQHILQAYS